MPQVFNKRTGNIPADSIYIGRPGPWGNPYKIGKDGTREEVIAKYRRLIYSNPTLVQAIRSQHRGKDLVCWCKPLPCHGDVLLQVANEE